MSSTNQGIQSCSSILSVHEVEHACDCSGGGSREERGYSETDGDDIDVSTSILELERHLKRDQATCYAGYRGYKWANHSD